jgi:hypothetical protein
MFVYVNFQGQVFLGNKVNFGSSLSLRLSGTDLISRLRLGLGQLALFHFIIDSLAGSLLNI